MRSQTAREQYLTEAVITWLGTDVPVHAEAGRIVGEQGTASRELGAWLWQHIRQAPRGTAAWYLAQKLAANDYFNIDWDDVARSVHEE